MGDSVVAVKRLGGLSMGKAKGPGYHVQDMYVLERFLHIRSDMPRGVLPGVREVMWNINGDVLGWWVVVIIISLMLFTCYRVGRLVVPANTEGWVLNKLRY